jgi:CheY-like chemotaxis protein
VLQYTSGYTPPSPDAIEERIMNKPPPKILVVDDDPVVAKSINRVLTAKGFAVINAQSGEEALKKFKNETYDVVFTDIKMPGLSGIEVAERIKASQPWLPVVIVTGYGSRENQARADAVGVSDFLNKPLSPEMIERSASKALEAHHPPATEPTHPSAAAEAATAPAVAPAKEIGSRSPALLPLIVRLLAAPLAALGAVLRRK